jgi:VanZ family protein
MKSKIKPIIYAILTAGWTTFIISMSTQTAVKSSGLSRGILSRILEFVCDITGVLIEIELVHNLFRKIAHFSEFFVWGIFAFLLTKSINAAMAEKHRFLLIPAGFIIAFFDELTQYLGANGRAMRFGDILIDTAGVTLAVLIMSWITVIFTQIKRSA